MSRPVPDPRLQFGHGVPRMGGWAPTETWRTVVTDPTHEQRRPHVVVVGGGISGLAAAWRLLRLRTDVDITVLEGSPDVGGKLRVGELEGIAVDEGAESVLATRPEAVSLIREVGLGDDVEHPETTAPRLLLRGELRPLPGGLVMGIPTDLSVLARSGVLSTQALARLPLDHVLPHTPVEEDISVGEIVGRRLGPEIAARLVAPLLIGVYADRVTNVSFRASMPRVWEAARQERSLMQAARSTTHARPEGEAPRPVFAGIRGGVGRLPLALRDRLVAAGVAVETDATVRRLSRRSQGWQLEVGPTTAPRLVEADAVILAVPAPASARLVRGLSVQAETELSEIQTTSVAVVSMLYRASDLPYGLLPEGSGYLASADEGRPVKASTFSSTKWRWLGDAAAARGLVAVRASLGHSADVETLQRDDDELARLAADDVAFAARLGRARPVASRVTRWGGGLPQYAVGHVDRVERIIGALDALPGLAVCGATYEGVGIAACVARADVAATRVSARLGRDGEWRHG